jgi:hypothetical protein
MYVVTNEWFAPSQVPILGRDFLTTTYTHTQETNTTLQSTVGTVRTEYTGNSMLYQPEKI